MSAAAAPRCCVIVVEMASPGEDLDPIPTPRILWMNGDEGEARKVADAWCQDHLGEPAHIMVIDDTRRAEIVIKGTKA